MEKGRDVGLVWHGNWFPFICGKIFSIGFRFRACSGQNPSAKTWRDIIQSESFLSTYRLVYDSRTMVGSHVEVGLKWGIGIWESDRLAKKWKKICSMPDHFSVSFVVVSFMSSSLLSVMARFASLVGW
ncbi:hypothetical protein NE237_032181 [Protea cynaroides]|uniref:Uncharacterized protein n=1 Tax=Protea cynaroides TaxID=273540 RepID=A0A9Q0R358_9MAGN|nr:hypothetical protein NE237_032181 [Protea cynaroides]